MEYVQSKYIHGMVEGKGRCLRAVDGVEDLSVGRLGLVAGVEQERVTLGPPGVVVTDTPHGDTNAVLLVHASLDDVGPIGGRSVLDVDLSHGALGSGTAKSSHSSDRVGTLTGSQVGLRTNTVNGNAGGDPLLDVADH
jgi:hypothetical protein